ncbi:hypothetical protein ACFLZI_03960, partial [Nitrospirota bacterium]
MTLMILQKVSRSVYNGTMLRASSLLSLVIIAIVLMGCGASFRPIEMDVMPATSEDSIKILPDLLMEHLATQRNVPFARDYLNRFYVFRGMKRSDDRNHAIFLLQSTTKQLLALPYAYVYLHLQDNPYIMTHENTSSIDRGGEGYSSEHDALYKGVYRLSLMNARICLGETKELPVIEGNEVKL